MLALINLESQFENFEQEPNVGIIEPTIPISTNDNKNDPFWNALLSQYLLENQKDAVWLQTLKKQKGK